MLRNLEAFVNTVEDTFRYPNRLVTAPAFFDRRMEYQHALLILKDSPDGLDIQAPAFSHFRRCIMALGRTR